MTKEKKANKYRPGPLFTKIPGARIPKKENTPPPVKVSVSRRTKKQIVKDEKPKLKLEDEGELLGIGIADTPVIDLTDPADVKKSEPIFDFDEIQPIKSEKVSKPTKKKESKWSDDSDANSRDSFDTNFIQPKVVKHQIPDDEAGTVPGFKKARAVKHKYQYNPHRPGGPKNIPCHLCNEKFNQTPGHPENFSNHIFRKHAIEIDDGKYTCKVCDHIARDRKAFRNHFNSHRILPKPKQCPTCGLTFTEYSKWRSHTHKDRSVANMPLEKRQFACELCGKICATKPSLAAHQINIHQQLGRKCRWCPKIVPYDEWDEHKKMEKIKHNVNTNVTCNICGATFTSKDSAANHRRNFQ